MTVCERPLTDAEFNVYQPFFWPRTLELARIIEGRVPIWLHRKMCAVVLGHRIYIRAEIDRPHVYQGNSARGVELLAHELTHVEQYLSGMTVFKYLWASRYGYRNNPYEIEAYAQGSAISAQLQLKLKLS